MFWLTMGTGLGFGASFWVTRAVRQRVERYAPTKVVGAVRGRSAEIRTTLAAAAAEGREAMRQREAELRGQLRPQPGTEPGMGQVDR